MAGFQVIIIGRFWVITEVFGVYFVIKAAVDLQRERVSEVAAYKPSVPEYKPKHPSRLPGLISAGMCILLLGLLAYSSYKAAFPRTKPVPVAPPVGPALPPPPESAHTPTPTPTIQPSFVLVAPGPLLNNDSWDFIVVLKGRDKAESIDIMFTDDDKLKHIRKTTPPGIVVMPNEYSLMVHIDKMFPKGRGSLFAKQFIWKPFSLEHGHYRVDISASVGRYQEDLYIEKVNDKWQYTAKLMDIDTRENRFVCRDPEFPKAVAPAVSTELKCWPRMIAED